MKLIVKSVGIKISPSNKQYIEEKIGGLERFLKKVNSDLVVARVEVGKVMKGQRRGDIFKIEVNLDINGKLIRASQKGESLMAAVDLVKDELSRSIKHYKEKQATKYIRGARSWKKFWRVNPLARFRPSKAGRIIKRK